MLVLVLVLVVMDFVAGFCLFLSFFAGCGFFAAVHWFIQRRALSIVRGQAGAKGRERFAEQETELMALIGEAAQAFKEGKDKGEAVADTAKRVLPALAMKYPTTALKFGKKLMKSFGGTDLEGLL